MNVFQICHNTSDVVPLYLPQQLFLKPIAKLNISIQLPQYKIMGKTISHWELMEKLRTYIHPDEFTVLKVTKTTREVIHFEAEVEHRNKLQKIIGKLENKMIKLSEINNLIRVRAFEAKLEFPNKHIWDSYFRDAKDMNEMKPGERPDTIYITNLPIRWFVPQYQSNEDDIKPSEKILYRLFEKFGKIRFVDIPVCDPYRHKMKSHMTGLQKFSFDEKEFFEGYIQFKDYSGFVNAMDAFRGMKLGHKEEDTLYLVDIRIDFDKTKHLSDATIKRREIVRDRLITKEKERQEKEQKAVEADNLRKEAEKQKEVQKREEKEKRRREREEKRKAKLLAKLKVKDSDNINDKIAKEEKKLLEVQRKLESIRLVEELFKRIQIKKETDPALTIANAWSNEEEVARFKNASELEVLSQREVLHRAIESRVVLKSILEKNMKLRHCSSSDSDSDGNKKEVINKNDTTSTHAECHPDPNWYNVPSHNNVYPYPMGAFYHPTRGSHVPYYPFLFRGRGRNQGSSRGVIYPKRRGNYYHFRGRGSRLPQYPPELQEEYYRYFQKFLHEDRYSRSRSRSSRSISRSRSRSRQKSYRSSSRSKKSYSRERSRSKSRSRSRYSRDRSNSRSRRSSSRRSHNKKSSHKSRSRYRRSTSKHKESRSPSCASVDSSKFISPSEMRNNRTASVSKE